MEFILMSELRNLFMSVCWLQIDVFIYLYQYILLGEMKIWKKLKLPVCYVYMLEVNSVVFILIPLHDYSKVLFLTDHLYKFS